MNSVDVGNIYRSVFIQVLKALVVVELSYHTYYERKYLFLFMLYIYKRRIKEI